jgi:sulfur-carrier protein
LARRRHAAKRDRVAVVDPRRFALDRGGLLDAAPWSLHTVVATPGSRYGRDEASRRVASNVSTKRRRAGEPFRVSPHGGHQMTIKYFATIRSYTGEAERRLESAPADLRELLTELAERYGTAFSKAVFAGAGLPGAKLPGAELGDAIMILVNGRNVLYLQGLDTPLEADDEVSIFPLVAGG